MNDELHKIAIFQKKEIRKQLYSGEWWFVISDVVGVLTDSTDPPRYLRNLRARDEQLSQLFDSTIIKGASQIEPPLLLSFNTPGGKQKLPCWNTEGIPCPLQRILGLGQYKSRWLYGINYQCITFTC